MLFEYSLLTDKKEVEPLTDFLMDRGAYSVSIEDADAFYLLFLKKNFFFCALRIVILSINRIPISYMGIVY